MTDLEKFQSDPPPRSVALCEPYVRKFVPIFGIVMWGIVYAFFSPLPAIAVGFGLGAIISRLQLPRNPTIGGAIVITAAVLVLAAFFAGWIPFALWARRWRASRRRFLREGVLIEATYVRSTVGQSDVGYLTYDDYRFTYNGKPLSTPCLRNGEHYDEPTIRTVTVLYHPDFSFGAKFYEGEIHYLIRWGGDVQPAQF